MSRISDSTISAITYRVDHGLIIVEDPASEFQHADWNASVDYVSIGPDSLYLSVQPAVDGPIDLIISKGFVEFDDVKHVYLDGQVDLKGRYVVVRDADDVMRFSVRCPRGENHVRVLVDEPGLVSKMHVSFMSS